jgi:hypothetical protein
MLGNGPQTLDIELLEAVAKARFGLMFCARYLHKLFIAKQFKRRHASEVGNLFDAASQLCDRVSLKWPR